MNQFEIKRVTLNDLEQLQELGRQTFSETFAAINTPENMKKYLEDAFSAEKLSDELQNKDSIFYFAYFGKRVVGYLKVNFGPSQTELKDNKSLEIERIYVLKEFHRKKVGQLLYEKARQIADQHQATYIWLGVWEENHRAISFYRNNGFEIFGSHYFKLGHDEQTDLLMKLSLR